jgi:DNA-directed RNA polymerase specialized sigma24 family protein
VTLLSQKLKEDEFVVLYLHDAEGYTFKEIGRRIDKSDNGAAVFYARSLAKATEILNASHAAGSLKEKEKNHHER